MTSPTYWDYLQLLPLLGLQGGTEGDDARVSEDELHFIIVHQVFELWMKLVLRELRLGRDRMNADWVSERSIPHVVRHLKRVNEIIKLSIDSFGVLETLTPQDFIAFRKKLGESSGAQSFQMRELEFLLGLEPTERERQNHPGDPRGPIESAAALSPNGRVIVERLNAARQEPSLRQALLNWLERTPIHGTLPGDPDDDDSVAEFLIGYRAGVERYDPRLLPEFDEFVRPNQRARAGLLFIESYRDLPLLSWPYLLIETVVEMEELLVLWRTRHARTVERMIGRRFGTGGSPGVAYLDATTRYRIFHEFWTVRTVLLPRECLPPLRNPGRYHLTAEEGTA